MDDKELVLVRSFDELRTGMRVAVDCRGCGQRETDVLGGRCFSEVVYGNPMGPAGPIEEIYDRVRGCKGWVTFPACIARGTVSDGRVFRFAADLGISGQLAREANPFTSRSVVGTAGRDEVVIARKERAR